MFCQKLIYNIFKYVQPKLQLMTPRKFRVILKKLSALKFVLQNKFSIRSSSLYIYIISDMTHRMVFHLILDVKIYIRIHISVKNSCSY